MSWGQWRAWQVHPGVVVRRDGRFSIGWAAGGEGLRYRNAARQECKEKRVKARKLAEREKMRCGKWKTVAGSWVRAQL